jgi:hypothetical protein
MQVTRFQSMFIEYATPVNQPIENPVLVAEYIRLYEKFIRSGSEQELNLPSHVIQAIRESVEKKEFYRNIRSLII